MKIRLVCQTSDGCRGGDNLFGWLKSMAGHNPSGLFAQALQWKAQMPHYVLLVQARGLLT